MTQEKTLEELQSDLEAKAEALVDLCNKSSLYCNADEVIAVEAALERLYRLRKRQDVQPAEPAAQPDIADIIAGVLQVSRGMAYELMLKALKEVQPAPTDGWLQDGGLLYRLTDDGSPQNRDEINVTMADGSRSPEARARRAGELLDRIRAGSQVQAREDWRPGPHEVHSLPPKQPAPVQPVAHVNDNGVVHAAGYPWGEKENLRPLVFGDTAPPAQPAAPQVYGWVRMNGQFNSGVFHLGRECPPGWVKAAEPVSLIVAADLGGGSEGNKT